MAFTKHLRMVFAGTLPGGEIWNIGLRTVTAPSDPLPVTLQQIATAADAAFRAHWTGTGGMGSIASADTFYVDCTVYDMPGGAGHAVASAMTSPNPVAGGGGTQTLPDQNALVVTTETGLSGRSGHGRFYLPCTALSQLPAGRVSSVATGNVATAAAAFITALNSIAPTGFTMPAVGIQSLVRADYPFPIVSVKVGDVVDTQRRRRDKLVENYTSHAV